MRARVLAALALFAAAPGGAQEPPCRPDIPALLAPAEFARYPAVPLRVARWAAPDVRTGHARLYRTLLRQEGKGPPDFAGRYKLVRLGCGAGVACPAFVDLGTGRVRVPDALPPIVAMWRDIEPRGADGFDSLNYRADSRLLVVIGQVGEDAPVGVSYFVWERHGPRLLRFLSEDRFCAGASS